MFRKIQETRKELRYGVKTYLELPNPPPYNLHLNQFAGAGKSTIVAEELANSDLLFVYLTNKHDLAGEQIEKQPALFELLEIESRRRLCQNEQYRILADHNINIKQFCPTCPNIVVCEYYQRIIEIWSEPQSWVGVHHHLGGLVNSYVTENDVDVVVIDEYFVNAIFKNVKIGYPSIVKTSNLMTLMRSCIEKDLIMDCLREFAIAIQNETVNTQDIWSKIFKYFHNSGHNAVFLLAFAEEYEGRLAQYYFDKGKIFANVVTPLCRALIDIYKHFIPMSMPNYLEYINNVMQVIPGEKRQYVDISFYDTEALNLGCKVIILDATTPVEFYQKLFDRQIRVIEKQINVNSVIYQLTSAKFVMRTLDKNVATRQRLLKLVQLISKKHEQEPILVLSRKKYEDEIKELASNIHTDHYPLVGSNDYELMNVVVIFGTPEPQRDLLTRQSTLLGCTEDELLYLLRESNILQGIHRIRITLKHDIPTYVYILTSVELPFTNAHKLSLGKLEKLLNEELFGFSLGDIEDRIMDDIIRVLDKGDLTITELVRKIEGKQTIVNEVLQHMVDQEIVEFTKSNSSRGRKPTICHLKGDIDELLGGDNDDDEIFE